MLIDYLRYLAFHGRLRGFIEDGLFNYAGDRAVNGFHLRISDDEMRSCGLLQPWRLVAEGVPPDWLAYQLFNLRVTGRVLEGKSGLRTFEYEEERPLKVEAIIDIDPTSWSEGLTEPRGTDFGTVVFRRSPPATAHLGSGEVIFDADRGRRAHGTLAGMFRSRSGISYALTCGHVARADATVILGRKRPWFMPWRGKEAVGKVCHTALPPAYTGARSGSAMIDAALARLEVGRVGRPGPVRTAALKAISGMIQEEPVHFHSSVRGRAVRARIAGVTIWKAMDLYRDNRLYDLGDVVMLGHPDHIYAASTVSRPGDSGAAVQQGWPSASTSLTPDWYGMVLGSDQAGAYATYAETLGAWATREIDDGDLDFVYES